MFTFRSVVAEWRGDETNMIHLRPVSKLPFAATFGDSLSISTRWGRGRPRTSPALIYKYRMIIVSNQQQHLVGGVVTGAAFGAVGTRLGATTSGPLSVESRRHLMMVPGEG
uniref:(northern house mosquito) hypothetical protein n=1 Tax=Culex pipiens TaxID=7175 RepID=A0A8D8B2X0_CULPI